MATGAGLPHFADATDDGTVEATGATSFVPEGFSVWEMATGRDMPPRRIRTIESARPTP